MIVGIGNLGHALANYSGFPSRGFRTVALLDADAARQGELVAGLKIRAVHRARCDRARARRRDRGDRHARGRRAVGVRHDGRRRDPQRAELRTDRAHGPPTASTSGWSTSPASCRSSPTTSSARPRRIGCRTTSRGGGRMSVLRRGDVPQLRPGLGPRAGRSRRRRALKLIHDVVDREHVIEATVLSTCNRIEVYAEVDRFHGSVEAISRMILGPSPTASRGPARRTSTCTTTTARSRTCSTWPPGLDSMVVGESQILGQTREALRVGQEAGTVGPALNSLFQQALRVGKRAHAETDIDRAGPSLVAAALDEAADYLGGDTGLRVVVVGAGAMAALSVATLARGGASSIVVANRTEENAAPAGRAVLRARRAAGAGGRPSWRAPTWSSPAPAPPAWSSTWTPSAARARDDRPAGRDRPRPAPRRRPGRRPTSPA